MVGSRGPSLPPLAPAFTSGRECDIHQRRRRRVFILVLFLGLTLFGLSLFLFRRDPTIPANQTFALPDGTSVSFRGITHGTNHWLYRTSWHRFAQFLPASWKSRLGVAAERGGVHCYEPLLFL